MASVFERIRNRLRAEKIHNWLVALSDGRIDREATRKALNSLYLPDLLRLARYHVLFKPRNKADAVNKLLEVYLPSDR